VAVILLRIFVEVYSCRCEEAHSADFFFFFFFSGVFHLGLEVQTRVEMRMLRRLLSCL
jgi:hypothetical protein